MQATQKAVLHTQGTQQTSKGRGMTNKPSNEKNESATDYQERLISGYNLMLERLKQLLDKAEEHTRPKMEELLETTRNKAIELNELTREEALKISGYIKRDLSQAAEYLIKTEKDLTEWFRFDIQLIEEWMLESFKTVADKTKLELMLFREKLDHGQDEFKTGEITGPGTLVCVACGKVMNFSKTAHIPPCPSCHKTRFMRQST
jgi:hypothetical protein